MFLDNEQYNVMIKNISKELESNLLKELIKKYWNKTNSLYVASIFIGEVFTYYFINKDFNDFEYYIKKMDELYDKTIDFTKYNYFELKKTYKNISNIFDEVILDTEEFKLARASIICESIARKLGFNDDIQILNKEKNNIIKNYFINEYIYNGFVIHSFHSSLFDSIMKNGLSSNDRLWDDSEIINIGNYFFEKGAFAALGGYTYYNGQGLYFEHNYRKLYSHAIYSPEWFNFLTSSNHLTGFPDIERAPFALKNYEACKQNVKDLCVNTNLDYEKTSVVMKAFEKYFELFKSKDIMVAIIPKKVVNKHYVNNDVLKNKDAIETIVYLSDDINSEYKEHFGNVWNGNISSDAFAVIKLPWLEKFISYDNFVRESKEELYEYAAVEHMKKHLARILSSVGETSKANELLSTEVK